VQKLKISPNPVDDKAKIEIPKGRKRKVVVLSVLGKLIAQIDVQDGQEMIYYDTKSLSSGTYFITVYLDGNQPLTTRLMVAH
jgi:Secretion system C-terminal sorting domain